MAFTDFEDGLLVLINNAENRQRKYMGLVRDVLAAVPDCEEVRRGDWTREQAKVYKLAEVLKDRFEYMIDDIQLLVDRMFPKEGAQVKGREDDQHAERTVMITALATTAYRQIDFHAIAEQLLNQYKEWRWR